MNPWELDSTGLMIWGLVAHLIADWPLQNDWMANNKATNLKANVVHSAIHALLLAFVFGWVAIPLAIVHGIIDTRKPVIWWSKFIGQTQPKAPIWIRRTGLDYDCGAKDELTSNGRGAPLMDVGMEVRFWTDQVFHIICIAVAALVVVSV